MELSGDRNRFEDRSYCPDMQFVMLNDVESTRVGVCGVAVSQSRGRVGLLEPILSPAVKGNFMTADCQYSVLPREVALLYLLDLEPNRRNVTISLDDSRLTKGIFD